MNKEILRRAFDLLSKREHSQQEIWQKLFNKDFSADDIPTVLTYLIEKDYLSDQRFS